MYPQILRKLQNSCVRFEYYHESEDEFYGNLERRCAREETFCLYMQGVIVKLQRSIFSGILTHLYQCERPLNPEVPNPQL